MARRTKKNDTNKKPPQNKATNQKAGYTENNDEIVRVKIKTHKDKNGGHFHVLVDEVDEKQVSVGLSTKKKKGKNHTNYPLEKSPLDDGKTSYMRRQGTVAAKGEYEKPRSGTMTPKDYKQAKVYGERAKNKYLAEKKRKKK